jgi:hypothetical protein
MVNELDECNLDPEKLPQKGCSFALELNLANRRISKLKELVDFLSEGT